MSLLNIIGSTGLNITFFIAFIFLSQETTPDYEWAMQILKNVLSYLDYTFPSIVITDKEVTLITALRLTFPNSKRLLCQQHVNKNVLSHVSSYFKEGEEWDIFMSSQLVVLVSTSTDKYREHWAELIDQYNDNFGLLVDYLKDTWEPFKQSIVQIWVDQSLHFGN